MDKLQIAGRVAVPVIVVTITALLGYWVQAEKEQTQPDTCQQWLDGINDMVSSFLTRSGGNPDFNGEYPKIAQEIKQFEMEC